ncbi:MAG: hypothetical protein E7287_05200 [Lachnospiraceae bacterium]|nr:hypothetical protein [Lachnospiraceae bacterium]
MEKNVTDNIMKDIDKQEMELLQAFDNELMKQEEYRFMMTGLVDWAMWAAATCGMLVPWSFSGDSHLGKVMPFLILLVGTLGMTLSLAPYMNVSRKKDNTGVSVYKILQYMPISQKTILRARQRLLIKPAIRYAAGFLGAQVLVALFTKNFGLVTVLYPLIMAALIVGVGYFYVSEKNWSKTDEA